MAGLMTTKVENSSNIFGNKKDLQDRCSVERNSNETFFYSNNPEKIHYEDLADDGKYLTFNGVRGSGQLYTWHLNDSGRTIHSVILVHNPNDYPINVSFTNIGLTYASYGDDRAAWEKYYNGGGNESFQVAANGYRSFLVQNNVLHNRLFGKIARFKITDTSGAAASAFFYDLVYITNSGNAHVFAPSDTPRDENPYDDRFNSRRRGTAFGYYNYLTIGTVSAPVILTAAQPQRAATIGGVNAQTPDIYDSFNGKDMVVITGGTGNPNDTVSKNNDSGYLYGCYGMQMRITMNVKNNSSQSKEIRIFMGCESIAVPVFARYNKAFYKITETVAKGNIRDVITLGTVAAGATQQITFDTVNLAQSAAPFFIGARLV